MKKQLTLGKKERLKSRKSIDLLFKEGKRFTVTPYRIFYTIAAGKEIKFGVGVSTKNFKKSPDRNRIKRLTREAWRLQKNSLQEKAAAANKGLHLFFIYTEKELPGYKQVFDCVAVVLQKLITIIEN